MSAVLLLAMAITGQDWKEQTTSIASMINDLEFTAAVEGFAMSLPNAAPPEPYRAMIDAMGADCWKCRERAGRLLQEASGGDRRWLFWGRKHKDPEVALRCNAIIRRLNVCPRCNGTGISGFNEGYRCWDCDGSRTAWPWSQWD